MKEAIALIIGVLTAMVGNQIHHIANMGSFANTFWCVLDFIFWPIAIIKWLIYEELTVSVIHSTFSFFFN